ncbi:PDZ and LIM domain protein 2 [Camelus dromedarius]|uniref:PDZ and LIM domain protein 2 n=1 Tax=Camelus dromedarius TaxID=9838 RepID=A0A5N4C4V8_CAMDR|nr:PDZ and LIM domain protein 2 [Camelus dromedarius]
MALMVDVVGPAPWGFRISGGRDFHTPIMVTKVTERGKAEAADLRPGDIIVAISGESAEGMLHAEAQSKIRQSPSLLRLQLDRSRAASPGQTNGESSVEEALEAEERGGTPALLLSSLSPQSALRTSRALATPPKLHTCEKCSASIQNQAVRIQEGRYRHPSFYTCADCGLNLKMRGHFWVGDELYCEKHARQRHSAPLTLSSQA